MAAATSELVGRVLLARLDDQDLRLERLRLVTQRAQRQTEYDRALAARQRAEAFLRTESVAPPVGSETPAGRRAAGTTPVVRPDASPNVCDFTTPALLRQNNRPSA